MPNCSGCGAEVVDSSRVCDSCGAPVDDSFATRTVAVTTPASTPVSASSRESRHSSTRLSSRSQGRFAPGELLGGRYRIVAMLGKGGMGEVYRADDLVLDQQVALKFLPEAVAHNERALERFRNEVRIARQVSHPNVCRVYDLGEMEGLYFLSMEYVDGEDLGSLLRRIGRLPTDKALEIARRLCAGLAAAHEKGVLHRDLKPSNVMLDGRGHVLLTDFGLAGLAGEIEGAEVRNGTPAYMAPEQLAGEEVTVRSDIYALGLVLYEIFTGKLPFESTTLAGLIRAQRESAPASPASIVRDLDPMVERVILRCLHLKPSMRPASALAVAAALPGGDPLAAALAAGETPSPEMVAAAGEGEGLALKYAIPLLLTVLIAMPVGFALRGSALTTVNPELAPEVLSQKAREIVEKVGGPKRPYDQAYNFEWDRKLFEWFSSRGDRADWPRVLSENPQALVFQYRSHIAPLTGLMFHDDMMTPGVIYPDDPPLIESGMTSIQLDAQGRLLGLERLPSQVLDKAAGPAPTPDWNGLFAAAGLDPATFQPAEPLWTSLAAADNRVAWSRKSPREQRVEAASLRGQPVFFRIIEPWTKPDRIPGASDSTSATLELGVLGGLLVIIIVAAAALAVGNLRKQRGDRRGAFRLALFTFAVHFAIWLTRGHITVSFGTFGGFLVALATSTFYAVMMWTVYVALEPYVRRRWPQALISWSTLWIGRVRDAVVGRDVLIGCAAGAFFVLIGGLSDAWLHKQGGWPMQDRTMPLAESRAYLAAVFMGFPNPIRNGLFFLLLIFLFRVALRNQWLAAVAFGLVFAAMSLADQSHPWFNFSGSFIVFFGLAFLVLRWGLLALCAEMLFNNLVFVPAAKPSAWYFTGTATLLLLAVGLSAWAFYTSLGGRKLWKEGLFD